VRVALERERARQVEEGDRRWRRSLWRLVAGWSILYFAGLGIAFGSFYFLGDVAQVALWGGLLLGDVAIMGFLFTVWARSQE